MGFSVHYQQRIALSRFAQTILENDCLLFRCVDGRSDKPSRHKFINRIFCNYYDRADASIQMRLTEKKESYQDLKAKKWSNDLEHFVNNILEKEKEMLTQKMEARLSADYAATSNVISLNHEALKILETSEEDAIYPKGPSKYIRAILEEYASLDALAREKIYFRKEIENLENFARSSAVIEITLADSSQRYQMIPFFIRSDIYKTHLYLAGISNEDKTEGKAVSFRVDRIDSIHRIRSESKPSISSADLEKAIEQQGIQYLTSNKSRIRIQLSPAGIRKYQRYTYQRPSYSSREGEKKDIYIFDIPEYQAQVYFFKFGADAVVLEPESLKQTFYQLYKKALANYTSSDK